VITTTHRLTCTCGWTHDASTRQSATKWKAWHRKQHTPKGSRPNESGHDVSININMDTDVEPFQCTISLADVELALKQLTALGMGTNLDLPAAILHRLKKSILETEGVAPKP
jgi:hypothetical protein